MSDPRSILILYGSQSGNSEDIAIQTGKAAVEYNLLPAVRAMDEITTVSYTHLTLPTILLV